MSDLVHIEDGCASCDAKGAEIEWLRTLLDEWKAASGLVDASGDPDGVRPEHCERNITQLELEIEWLKGENARLRNAKGKP